MTSKAGLHHVTGITGDPQANLDFYVGLLGLRLVKRTVSHSDSRTLHLFYGDADARPGTLLSFFAWPDTASGRRGYGQAAEVGLVVPRSSVGAWTQHLLAKGVRFEGPTEVGDTSRISLQDPDGLPLVLVGVADAPDGRPWVGSSLPSEMQPRGLHHVTLWTEVPAQTGHTLTRHLGFEAAENEGGLLTYRAKSDGSGAELGHTVYVRDVSGFWSAADGVGTLHHVAFRTNDAVSEARILEAVRLDGLTVSEVREHGYFRSIYFREPGGCLLEVATDGPGFTLDEDSATLGEKLVLPPELEPERQNIEVTLPTVALPGAPRYAARDLGWIHRFVSGTQPLTLLLLHGTGGNELDLLAFGRRVAPGANLLSVRGRSLEEGSPRFFRRYSPVLYDQDDLRAEAAALALFVQDAADLYGLEQASVVALGYSNGANIALATLVQNPKVYAGAVLLRPVMVLENPLQVALAGLPVLVLSGLEDEFLPLAEPVTPYLRALGADVAEERLNAGHELTPEDETSSAAWLGRFAHSG